MRFSPTCEALIICAGYSNNNGDTWRNGEPCGRDATAKTDDGHGVCHLHLQALTGPRAESGPPVEFAQRLPVAESMLSASAGTQAPFKHITFVK